MPERLLHRAGRRVALAVSSVVIVTVLAACGAGSRASSRPVVTVFGNTTGQDAAAFVASLDAFERSSGIDVRYVGSSDFETDLVERVRRGDLPDLALVPQPSLLRTLVGAGVVVALPDDLAARARAEYDPRLVDLVTSGGHVQAAWYEVTLKSLIWYSPRELARLGLAVPTTWDDLTVLADAAMAAGIAPWCIGTRDGGSSGWAATDWIEDLVLRFAGPDVYDGWVDHTIAFTDDRIVGAFDRFGAIALDARQVAGGPRAAVEQTIEEAANALTASPPACLLHHQASFFPQLLDGRPTFSPTGDVWMFPMPAAPGGGADPPPPLVVGATLLVAFDARPEVQAVQRFLMSTDAAHARIADRSSFISPLRSVAPADYPSARDGAIAGWLAGAATLRFDASDLMPPDVGLGAFWTGMTSYLGGAPLGIVLRDIDDAWVAAQPRLPVVATSEVPSG